MCWRAVIGNCATCVEEASAALRAPRWRRAALLRVGRRALLMASVVCGRRFAACESSLLACERCAGTGNVGTRRKSVHGGSMRHPWRITVPPLPVPAHPTHFYGRHFSKQLGTHPGALFYPARYPTPVSSSVKRSAPNHPAARSFSISQSSLLTIRPRALSGSRAQALAGPLRAMVGASRLHGWIYGVSCQGLSPAAARRTERAGCWLWQLAVAVGFGC
jgi:hypothetical protein